MVIRWLNTPDIFDTFSNKSPRVRVYDTENAVARVYPTLKIDGAHTRDDFSLWSHTYTPTISVRVRLLEHESRCPANGEGEKNKQLIFKIITVERFFFFFKSTHGLRERRGDDGRSVRFLNTKNRQKPVKTWQRRAF